MVKPVLDNILIKPFESDNVSEGGILVPNSFLTRNNNQRFLCIGIKLNLNDNTKTRMDYGTGNSKFLFG